MNQDLKTHLQYQPELDGIRGIMTFGVLLAHINYSWLPGSIIYMNVFFMLSSYLITSVLLRDIKVYGKIRYKIFYLRRFFRLLPAYYFMIIIFLLAVFIFLPEPKKYLLDVFYSACYVANWARAFGTTNPDWLGHTWSLSIEEQFYLVWPIVFAPLVLHLGLSRRLLVCLASFALLASLWRIELVYSGASIARLYNGTDTRVDVILMGAIVAVILQCNATKFLALTQFCQKAFLLSTFVVFICFGWSVHWQDRSYYSFFSIFSNIALSIFFIGLVTLNNSAIHRLLRSKLLVFLGRISYPTYLWHFPIFCFAKFYSLRSSEIFYFCVPATYLVAIFSYKFVEKPCNQIKDRYY